MVAILIEISSLDCILKEDQKTQPYHELAGFPPTWHPHFSARFFLVQTKFVQYHFTGRIIKKGVTGDISTVDWRFKSPPVHLLMLADTPGASLDSGLLSVICVFKRAYYH